MKVYDRFYVTSDKELISIQIDGVNHNLTISQALALRAELYREIGCCILKK